jgi:hypothetical protein
MNSLLDIEVEGQRIQLHLGTNLAAHSFYSDHQMEWGELCDSIRKMSRTHLRAVYKAKEVSVANNSVENH